MRDGAGKAALSTKLYYGFGAVAFGIKQNGFSFFLLIYYNQVLGLPEKSVGLAIMVALLIDAFSDPIVGGLSDRLHSRWGRRHPFMYLSALPVGISYFFLWNPPAGLTPEELFRYLVFLALLVRVFITFFEIPNTSLISELTEDYDDRTSMMSYRYFFGWLGGLSMSLLAYGALLRPTSEHPVGVLNPAGYRTLGLVAACVIVLSILVSSLGTHRNIPHLKQPPPKRPFGIMPALHELRETLSNRSFLVLFGSGVFAAMAAGLSAGLNIYFVTYFWELTSIQIFFLVTTGFPQDAQPGAVDPQIITHLALVFVPVLSVLYLISAFFVAAFRISKTTHEENLRKLAGRIGQPAG